MSRRADVVGGVAHTPVPAVPDEHSSGVGPAFTEEQKRVIADAWPLRSHLELGALPSAVPSARLHSRLVVAEWGLAELAAAVELVVSEIATNAVQASAGLTGSRYQGRWRPGRPPVRLWLRSDRERVLIQVWDGNDQMPRRPEPEPDAEHGRGLLLVESLSAEWGAFRPDGSGGKVVWARCDRGLD
jgi:anti-sigma regulatory factor (Ser/Thr protein kinase)